jgi:hypothetical protein
MHESVADLNETAQPILVGVSGYLKYISILLGHGDGHVRRYTSRLFLEHSGAQIWPSRIQRGRSRRSGRVYRLEFALSFRQRRRLLRENVNYSYKKHQ